MPIRNVLAVILVSIVSAIMGAVAFVAVLIPICVALLPIALILAIAHYIGWF